MAKQFKPQKLKGFIKQIPGKNGRTTLFVDYGGTELRKILEANPVEMEDCYAKDSKLRDIEKEVCIAQAYLSEKDCKNTEKWALKAFARDKWYEENEPVLDLIGIYQKAGECIDSDEL